MGEIGLGIIGVGGFGVFCLDNCRVIPGVKIAGIADINAELLARTAAEFAVPFATTDWHELLANPAVDVVHIVTPPYLHAEQAIAACRAGKHVFCEKPIAITMDEADGIFAAARENNVRVGIDFVMRYSRLYEIVREIISRGYMGRPLRFLFENSARDLPPDHWFWNPRLSGGIPIEHGVHFFDIFASYFGNGALQWAGRTCRASGEQDKWLAVLRYAGGLFGSFYHAFDAPGMIERTWSVIDFERGFLRLDGWIPELLTIDAVGTEADVRHLADLIPGTQIDPIPAASQQTYANGVKTTVTHRVHGSLPAGEKQAVYGLAVRDAMADFIAWTQDPSHHPRVTGEDGREALRVAVEVTEVAGKISPC